MASPAWSLLTASALAALTASCITPPPDLPHPEEWAAVRQAYAAQHAERAAGQGGASAAAPIETEQAFDEAGRRDDWAWESARRRHEVREYERYLREHRDGAHRGEAQRRIDQLRAGDEADWSRADLRDNIEAYQYYLANNPEGAYRDQAYRRIRELRDLQFMRRLQPPRTPSPAQVQPRPAAPAAAQPLTPRPAATPLERQRAAPAPSAPSAAAPPPASAAPARPAQPPAQPGLGRSSPAATPEEPREQPH